ncbi:MAG: hypothetical protein KTR25_10680 [Myxococcales bacterium]|nr:hypothetical protein [Myxococcales bacterium]
MTVLEIPGKDRSTTDEGEIRQFLNERGILFERWAASVQLSSDASPADVLDAYAHELKPYMEAHGYLTADVIRILPTMDGLDAVRAKFLDEHTHSEDEIRFFVEGKGAFWFNLARTPADEVFCLICEAGDFISVPAGFRHWFDMGASPKVTAIRVFSNKEGWVPQYTDSGISHQYNKPYEVSL